MGGDGWEKKEAVRRGGLRVDQRRVAAAEAGRRHGAACEGARTFVLQDGGGAPVGQVHLTRMVHPFTRFDDSAGVLVDAGLVRGSGAGGKRGGDEGGLGVAG